MIAQLKPSTISKSKGDVLKVAQLANIMGSKNCAQLIPLCHPIPVDGVTMNLELVPKKCTSCTGEDTMEDGG